MDIVNLRTLFEIRRSVLNGNERYIGTGIPNIIARTEHYDHNSVFIDRDNEYIPIYHIPYFSLYNNAKFNDIPASRLSLSSPILARGGNLRNLPLGSVSQAITDNYIINRVIIKSAPTEGIEFDIGRFYLRDHTNNKILFIGLVKTSCVINKKEQLECNQTEFDRLLQSRKYPLLFYMSPDLIFDPKYKGIFSNLKDLIFDILGNPLIRVIFSQDPLSDFFRGFNFPKFDKKIDEVEYFENLLRDVISEIEVT